MLTDPSEEPQDDSTGELGAPPSTAEGRRAAPEGPEEPSPPAEAAGAAGRDRPAPGSPSSESEGGDSAAAPHFHEGIALRPASAGGAAAQMGAVDPSRSGSAFPAPPVVPRGLEAPPGVLLLWLQCGLSLSHQEGSPGALLAEVELLPRRKRGTKRVCRSSSAVPRDGSAAWHDLLRLRFDPVADAPAPPSLSLRLRASAPPSQDLGRVKVPLATFFGEGAAAGAALPAAPVHPVRARLALRGRGGARRGFVVMLGLFASDTLRADGRVGAMLRAFYGMVEEARGNLQGPAGQGLLPAAGGEGGADALRRSSCGAEGEAIEQSVDAGGSDRGGAPE